ncbi:hypothetical protein C8J57DRAFT_1072076, partial [Mycena rebaudengoi]
FTGIRDTTHSVSIGFSLPPFSSATIRGEFIGNIIAPIADKWVGVAFSGQNGLGVVAFPNATHILGSPRILGTKGGFVPLPTPYEFANISTIAHTINATHWNWIYHCQNCTFGRDFGASGVKEPISYVVGLCFMLLFSVS